MKSFLRDELKKYFLFYKTKYPASLQKRNSLIINNLYNYLSSSQFYKIAIYTPLQFEPDILAIKEKFNLEKEFLYPKGILKTSPLVFVSALDQKTEKDCFGMTVPSSNKNEKPDLVIFPCVAFDLFGYRLGSGSGAYDRIFQTLECKKMIVAFDFQCLRELPREQHDIRSDLICTDSGISVGREL